MPGWDGLYLFEVAGMNYFRNVEDETVHKRNPGCIIYASESFPLEAFDFWMDVVDRPWKIGDYQRIFLRKNFLNIWMKYLKPPQKE